MYYPHKEILMLQADSVFKAIAHPTRRSIISLLAISARSVKDLTAEFDISQSAISQHLRELKDADLVTADKVGLEQHYRLTPRPLKHVLEWSEKYRTLIDPSGHAWSFTKARGKPAVKQPARRKRNGR